MMLIVKSNSKIVAKTTESSAACAKESPKFDILCHRMKQPTGLAARLIPTPAKSDLNKISFISGDPGRNLLKDKFCADNKN